MSPTNVSAEPSSNPWHAPDVARAQRALVETQLADEFACAPFQAFLRAMRHVFKGAALNGDSSPQLSSLLDVGCGVGHYAVLCKRHYPRLNYFGADASPAMVNEAADFLRVQDIAATINLCAFEEVPFYAFRLVLIAQVMEIATDPEAALRAALAKTVPDTIIIFHRVRWSARVARRTIEKTYLDLDSPNFIWNEQDFLRTCMEFGVVNYLNVWERGNEFDVATLIVQRQPHA